ncbi:hypothetical protein ACN28C_04415 [Plantactinospora sp. WMMC1484]|uniref:hypothetical protein n=1 Tax=Plantactinospora sp. WMMC1484 TaxID=3404122 RepID=UPI003BF6162B
MPVEDPSAAQVGRWTLPAASGHHLPDGTLDEIAALFSDLRGLGQRQPPAIVLPTVLAQAHTLRALARTVTATERPSVLMLAARFAEYAGWCLQEAGDDAAALLWTGRAAHLAAAGGDAQFAAYTDVRRALVSLYRHDAVRTVELARRAESVADDHRVRGLAAQREAQGHALGGDEDACRRALDRAARHLALAPPATPVVGTSTLSDPAGMVRGWCLYDLGRPVEAARILEHQLTRVAPAAIRTRVRFGARLALAYAEAAELEQTCELTNALLGPAAHVDSATVRSDFARLGYLLNRWRREPAVRELLPKLRAVLHVSSIS